MKFLIKLILAITNGIFWSGIVLKQMDAFPLGGMGKPIAGFLLGVAFVFAITVKQEELKPEDELI